MPIKKLARCGFCGAETECVLVTWFDREFGFQADYACDSCQVLMEKVKQEMTFGGEENDEEVRHEQDVAD